MVSAGDTILVVDDDEDLLSFFRSVLEGDGHRVLTAASGEEALAACEEHPGDIKLFIVDVVIPDLSGPALSERLKQQRPGAKVVYTSGYGEAAAVALRQRDPSADFLKKPFSPDELSETVRRSLAP